MNKSEIRSFLENSILDMVERELDFGEKKRIKSVFLGTYMALDPCGRYHSAFSPNSITKECETFWDTMEDIAGELNCWIETGEGDPCDLFLCKEIERESLDTD